MSITVVREGSGERKQDEYTNELWNKIREKERRVVELEAELAESNSINQRQAALIVKIESCRQRERAALLPISRLRNEFQLTEEMVDNAKQALKGG